jgi:hypothetical protein
LYQKNGRIKLKRYVPALIVLVVLLLGSLGFYVIQMKVSFDLSIQESLSDLANPYARHVKIAAGMRREEVADRFAKSLGWTDSEKYRLAQYVYFNDEIERRILSP